MTANRISRRNLLRVVGVSVVASGGLGVESAVASGPIKIERKPNFVGERAAYTPSVAFYDDEWHMVWPAENDKRTLLHATSHDGLTWTRQPDVSEQSDDSPALVVFRNRLFVIFIANNNTRKILVSVFDDIVGKWTSNLETSESSVHGPCVVVKDDKMYVYFMANNDTHDILQMVIA